MTIYESSSSQNINSTNDELDVGELGSEEMLRIFKAEEKIQFEYKRLDKALRTLQSETEVNKR